MPDLPPPIATWDATSREWMGEHWRERIAWAREHIPRVNDTYRTEFHLIDAPFMVAYRFAVNEGGHKWARDAGGEWVPVTEDPAIVPLAELPPAHLLKAH
jgi:hypothetical protein